MAAGGNIVRGELFQLAFAPEAVYGTVEVTANYTRPFGVVQTASLPDPQTEYVPIYAMGNASVRNWYVTYKGRRQLNGSIPDIMLLNGVPIYLPIGTVATTGPVGGVYTHTISEAINLKSISVHATYKDSSGAIALMRRWAGGKCNRATFEAMEGDFLKMSIDEISFLNYLHNQNFADDSTHYSAGVADINSVLAYPTTQPYLFSYGALSLGGTEFARIRNFRLEISNNLEPKFYVTDDAVFQLPFEHREGRREYRLACTVDIEDAALYKELVRQGSYTAAFTGFQTIITFTRGTGDVITFIMPSSTPAAGGDNMGCLIRSASHNIVTDPAVAVTLDIIGRKLQVVVTDAIVSYPSE